jgi:VWFA-related protein
MKYKRPARVAPLVLAVVAMIGNVVLPAVAQSNDSQTDSNLILKRTVRRVILDVVVTDANGKPVPALAQGDFSVREDNKKQKILSFDVHDLESGSDFAKLPPLPSNTFINVPAAPEHGPLYVLLLDLVNTDNDDEPYARRQLLKFISAKPAGTRFAIFVLSDELYLAQGFTDDQAKLTAVLDPSHPRHHIPRIFLYQDNFGRGNPGKMVHVFTTLAQYLDGLPGRKNLLWFAGHFPIQLFPDDGDPVEYKDQVKGAINALALAQASIYPVDIRGVVVENAHAPGGATGGGGLDSDYRTGGSAEPANDTGASGSSPGGTQGDYQPNQAQAAGNQGYALLAHDYMIEDEIAKVTGGRAFYSNNDLSGALSEATENGASYYTLTYSPTNEKYDGSLRKISVDLSQKGYHLSYRRSYYSTDPDADSAQEQKRKQTNEEESQKTDVRKIGDSLYANMQHGAPLAHQLYFRAHVQAEGTPALATAEQMASLQDQPAFFRARRKNRPLKPLPPVQLQTYSIEYTVMAANKTGTGNARPPALEVAAAAFDSEGRMLNGVVENTASPTPQSTAASGVYRAQQEIVMPLTATSIRVAMRDVTTDRIGAIEVSLPLAPEPAGPAATADMQKAQQK